MTDGRTDTHRQRQAERRTDGQTHTDRQTETGRKTERDRKTGIQTDREADVATLVQVLAFLYKGWALSNT